VAKFGGPRRLRRDRPASALIAVEAAALANFGGWVATAGWLWLPVAPDLPPGNRVSQGAAEMSEHLRQRGRP